MTHSGYISELPPFYSDSFASFLYYYNLHADYVYNFWHYMLVKVNYILYTFVQSFKVVGANETVPNTRYRNYSQVQI